MSKDPAFLFYTSDFLTGTMTFTNEQVGKYIRLLCLQQQKGLLTEKDMLFICQKYDEDIWLKFIKTDEGLFYNERCKFEIDRRKKYSESRSSNRNTIKSQSVKLKKKPKSYVKHMETETVIETVSLNSNKKEKNKLVFPFLSNDFIKAWEILINEAKWRKKSPTALQASLNKLAAFGEAGAIESINDAISGAYQGVFPPKNFQQQTNQNKVTQSINAHEKAKQMLKNDNTNDTNTDLQ